MYLEKRIHAIRACWVAVVQCIAFWSPIPTEAATWYSQALFTLASAALLQLIAIRLSSKFASNVAFVLALLPSFLSMWESFHLFSLELVLVGLVTIASLVLFSGRPEFFTSASWWVGFIRPEHYDLAKRGTLVSMGSLLRVPLLALIFAWIKNSYLWMRYFKGGGRSLNSNDLMFTAANVYGALFIANQMTGYLQFIHASLLVQKLCFAAMWALWGLGLMCLGIWRQVLFPRFIGIVFMIIPVIKAGIEWPSQDNLFLATLAILIGLVFLISGMVGISSLTFKPTMVGENNSLQQPVQTNI
jgi:hypothetical protein